MPVRGIEQIVLDQRSVFDARDPGVPREVDFQRYMSHDQVVVVSGIRRCGKSTLLRQFAQRYDHFYYINFDDERLINFTVKDFSDLMLCFRKQDDAARVIFMDEVQNIDQWERFVRRVQDEGYKVFLTGSNARLLSSELGTHLTGRYARIELFPFSFSEFLVFHRVTYEKLTSQVQATVLKMFDDYLVNGGFPEVLKYGDREFLARTYEDILHRDIISRMGIKDVKAFQQLCHYVFSNATGDLSYNALVTSLGIKSPMTVKNYIHALQESYLAFELYKYDFSVKKQYVSSKKIYVIDNGMRNTVAFFFSEDLGKQLENLVFTALRQRGDQLYLFKGARECDFLVEVQGQITQAIQVCYDLTPENVVRELNGLTQAMDAVDCSSGMVLTYNQDGAPGFVSPAIPDNVQIKPVWKWLLF